MGLGHSVSCRPARLTHASRYSVSFLVLSCGSFCYVASRPSYRPVVLLFISFVSLGVSLLVSSCRLVLYRSASSSRCYRLGRRNGHWRVVLSVSSCLIVLARASLPSCVVSHCRLVLRCVGTGRSCIPFQVVGHPRSSRFLIRFAHPRSSSPWASRGVEYAAKLS